MPKGNISYTSQQPIDDFGLQFTELSYDTTLAANVAQSLTVPGQFPRYKAVFHFTTNDVWVAVNETATVAGAAFAITPAEMDPSCREVIAGDVLSFITANTNGAIVNVVFYPYYAGN